MDFDAETLALTGLTVTPGRFRTPTRLSIDRLVQLDADHIVMSDAVSADIEARPER